MPGGRATPAQKERFWQLVKSGFSARQAGLEVGMSETWGWRQMKGLSGTGADTLVGLDRRLLSEAPDPKSWQALDGGVRDTLREDGFNLFCEVFLCRRPAAWRQDAALRVVEWLLDRSERTFVDVNTPPGAGKSTLFTHDIPLWLVCGGGVKDPAIGRALRMLLGHESKNVAEHYVMRLRRIFEMRRPFYDKEQKRSAELVLTDAFGRFKPVPAEGEESVWAKDQFLVAQLQTVDLYEKEPTIQAASRQAGFLGERVDFYAWDDLATYKNARNPEVAEETDSWFNDEAETRLEPGGVGLLIGQRLGPLDLHRKRLDKTWVDEEGVVHQKYRHIVYPAHSEVTCDGDHRQWDLANDGCLLDDYRLPWKELQKIQHEPNYRTVYQQEDADPEAVLVLPVWLDGGTDAFGYDAPGCYDRDRGFFEVPDVAPAERFVSYATVDPSAGNWWVIEWWALLPGTSPHPQDWFRYLIFGHRAKLQAGGPNGFLDWDNETQSHVGWMEKLQARSKEIGLPIRVWVIEKNAAHRHVFQYDHFRRWRHKWPWVQVIGHETQRNKHDPDLGVEGRLRMAYRSGLKRLPRQPGPETLNYMRVKVKELTTYPQSEFDDTVMADWFGETNLEAIARARLRSMEEPGVVVNAVLPPYLRRQRQEIQIAR